MTQIVGELTAGEVAKKQEETCRTCGNKGKISPGGYCIDVDACTARRQMRASGAQNLREPCLVKIYTRGSTYYLREFGPKMSPMPLILPPGFTTKDYEANPARLYYEAILERGSATDFKVARALQLAKAFDGTAVNK